MKKTLALLGPPLNAIGLFHTNFLFPRATVEVMKKKILSWQARTLRSLLYVKNLLHQNEDQLDVEGGRANLELAGEFYRPIVHIDYLDILANGVPGEWIIPEGAETEHIILYLHGGSYSAGSSHSHRALAGNIAYAAKARALTIDYRLAPEHPYPAALEDALAAYEWLIEKHAKPEQITVAGDSAGGGLTIALLVALRERDIPMPASAVVLSPWTDLTASGESWQTNAEADYVINGESLRVSAQLYLDSADPRDPLASPVYANLAGLPPLLIQVGSDEILLSDSTHLAEHARRADVDVTLEIWDGMQHVWHFAANLVPEARQAIEKIGEFIMAKKKDKPDNRKESQSNLWSKHVTETSNALDLEPKVFAQDDPRRIAQSLKRSAERSKRRKSEPFRSAMSMLNLYINRAGKKLPKERRDRLEAAKDELRALYGRPRQKS